MVMKLPRRLIGRITKSEWNQIRPERLVPCDRKDIVDILSVLILDTPAATRRTILKIAEGLADDFSRGYCEDNKISSDELRAGIALADAVTAEMSEKRRRRK